MAKNILNMIIWHPDMDVRKSKISYIHRGASRNMKIIEGSSIGSLKGGFLILKDGTQIPFHRIIKIEYEQEIIWMK